MIVLASCGPASLPPGDTIEDADEAQNRAIHEFNVELDRRLVGPAARGYGNFVPQPVRRGVSNFASNLAQPTYVLNNLLQVRVGQASQNTLRFLINTTIGIGGIFDPATPLGVPAAETGFGETLHIYGVEEGDFVMLPGLGPSTTRDTVGLVVDVATNPVRLILPSPESGYVFAPETLDLFGQRFEADAFFDEILFESADSYSQLRTLYLQSRRFELGRSDMGNDPFIDPFSSDDDPFIDPFSPDDSASGAAPGPTVAAAEASFGPTNPDIAE